MKNFYKQFISVENLQLELYIHLLTLFCDFLFIFWVNPLPMIQLIKDVMVMMQRCWVWKMGRWPGDSVNKVTQYHTLSSPDISCHHCHSPGGLTPQLWEICVQSLSKLMSAHLSCCKLWSVPPHHNSGTFILFKVDKHMDLSLQIGMFQFTNVAPWIF